MRQWTVDAFAAAPFRGNPACVLEPMQAWPTDAWMQHLASENNQAETAFLRNTSTPGRYDLRWFSPTMEVPLCGHATLAAAHVLFCELHCKAGEITFDSLSGPLLVNRMAKGYAMDFPSSPPARTDHPDGLAQALGVEPVEVWAAQYLVALLKDESAVRDLKPDIAAIGAVSGAATGGRGNLAVAALADASAPYDVVDRFFAPGSGIPEDPATGSAHCILAPLFSAKLGRPIVRFHQAYPGRGGDFETELRGDRVILRGDAITVLESRLRV